jgi:hypothetical protein
MVALSIGAGESSDGAIKTQHRLTEGDRFLGSRPREGIPEGCKLPRSGFPRADAVPNHSHSMVYWPRSNFTFMSDTDPD